MWLDIVVAGLAAVLYLTLTRSTKMRSSSGRAKGGGLKEQSKAATNASSPPLVEANAGNLAVQQAAKVLRQGKLNEAIPLVKQLRETKEGQVPTVIAHRLLVTLSKSPALPNLISELKPLQGKITALHYHVIYGALLHAVYVAFWCSIIGADAAEKAGPIFRISGTLFLAYHLRFGKWKVTKQLTWPICIAFGIVWSALAVIIIAPVWNIAKWPVIFYVLIDLLVQPLQKLPVNKQGYAGDVQKQPNFEASLMPRLLGALPLTKVSKGGA